MPTFSTFTSAGWNKIEDPKVGEFVAMHLWEVWDKKEKVERVWRAIFVGPRPWGERGARKGVALQGREILRSADLRDDMVECLMADLLTKAIHLPGQDSRVVDFSGDQALTLKDQGYRPDRVPLYCPKCPVAYLPEEIAGTFEKGTTFSWGCRETSGYKSNPKKVGFNPCLRCFKSYLEDVDKWIQRANAGLSSVTELVSGNILPPNAISSDGFGKLRERVAQAISDIENGR